VAVAQKVPHDDDRKGGQQYGAGTTTQQSDSEASGFRDPWAAIIFIIHVGVILWLGLGKGLKALRENDPTR